MRELNVDNETFKKLKKHKKVIYLQLEDSNTSEIENNFEVIISNQDTKKELIRKVKKVYRNSNLEELKGILKKKTKYISPKNFEEVYSKEENIVAFEFKYKKKIFRKLFLGIFVVVLCLFINNLIQNYISKMVIKDVENFKKEEEVIAIIDINPSIALKIKNGTVIESKCLDQDCNDLLEKMNYTYNDNLNNQKLDKVLNEFYQGAKSYGYDTSNGITVSSSSSVVQVLVSDVKEATYKHITVEEENNVLNEVNVEFSESELTKTEYNNKLLEKLKKDPDYGELFTCDIYDEQVKCYMVDFMADIMSEFGKDSLLSKLAELESSIFKFRSVLKKFDFQYKINPDDKTMESITLGNGITFGYGDSCFTEVNNGNNETIASFKITNCLSYGKETLGPNYEILESKSYMLSFSKVELLTKTYDTKDIIFIDNTTSDPIILYGIEEDIK